MADPARFRSRPWAAMQEIFAQILAHPFVAGLTDGQVRATPVMPTTLAYTSYLLRSCHQMADGCQQQEQQAEPHRPHPAHRRVRARRVVVVTRARGELAVAP